MHLPTYLGLAKNAGKMTLLCPAQAELLAGVRILWEARYMTS